MTAPVSQSIRLAMTSPVAQSGSTIRFFLPSGLTADTAPLPLDERVRLVTVPGETVAVLRSAGSTAPVAVAGTQAALMALVKNSGWVAEGSPYMWFYDPPWTLPPFRRNEAVVQVHR